MDNFYNPGANVAMASDEVSGKHYQKVKLVYGADDTANNVSNSSPFPVQLKAGSATGLSIKTLLSGATTNATSVKTSSGQVYGWSITNTNAAVMYVKLYNKASAPTVGTDVPVITIAVPGSVAGGGTNFNSDIGVYFSTGIAFATTTGPTTADTNAVAANEVIVNLFYD